jgi:hypothetical protein
VEKYYQILGEFWRSLVNDDLLSNIALEAGKLHTRCVSKHKSPHLSAKICLRTSPVKISVVARLRVKTLRELILVVLISVVQILLELISSEIIQRLENLVYRYNMQLP